MRVLTSVPQSSGFRPLAYCPTLASFGPPNSPTHWRHSKFLHLTTRLTLLPPYAITRFISAPEFRGSPSPLHVEAHLAALHFSLGPLDRYQGTTTLLLSPTRTRHGAGPYLNPGSNLSYLRNSIKTCTKTLTATRHVIASASMSHHTIARFSSLVVVAMLQSVKDRDSRRRGRHDE